MTFPIAIEPHWNPAAPAVDNGALLWILWTQKQGKPYIQNDGTVGPGNSPCSGQWVDIPADQVPGQWATTYPQLTAPQKWVCSDPSQPGALIYQYADLYGRAGYDLWVLGAEAQAALDASNAVLVDTLPDYLLPHAAAIKPVQPAPPPVVQIPTTPVSAPVSAAQHNALVSAVTSAMTAPPSTVVPPEQHNFLVRLWFEMKAREFGLRLL